MKRLYLLRHAKSSWDVADIADHERPLNRRGESAARFMGSFLAKQSFIPDLIIVSTAVRTRMTAELLTDAGQLRAPIKYEANIYEATVNRLCEILRQIDENSVAPMLIGHNPGIEGLIHYLTGHIEPMPTAALAIIEIDVRWDSHTNDCGRLIDVFRPRILMEPAK